MKVAMLDMLSPKSLRSLLLMFSWSPSSISGNRLPGTSRGCGRAPAPLSGAVVSLGGLQEPQVSGVFPHKIMVQGSSV